MKNKNSFRAPCALPLSEDGVLRQIPIDQFPVSDKGLQKDDGFPMSDIGLLDRFSRDANVDPDFVKKVAARCEKIQEQSPSLSIDEEIRCMRPAWCQTPAEYAVYSESVYQYLRSKQNVSKTDEVEKTDVDSSADSDTSSSSSSSSVASSSNS